MRLWSQRTTRQQSPQGPIRLKELNQSTRRQQTATPTAPALVVIPFELEPDEAAPTPPALIILPGGGSGDGMEGIIVTEPDLATFDGDSGAPVFRRSISLQMIVRILDEGSADGSGIERVEIEVVDDEGETVYTKIENDAGYCLFGGGEPDCATGTPGQWSDLAGHEPTYRGAGIHSLLHSGSRGFVHRLRRVAARLRGAHSWICCPGRRI